MGVSKAIKQLMQERDMKVKELAEAMGLSAQNMSNKLYRDCFSYNEVVKIADILNCDIKIITRDTGKEFF